MAFSILSNIVQWAGGVLSPASNTSPTGTETAPAVRNIPRKYSQVLTVIPLAANATYTSAWFDTQASGDMIVEASCYVTGANGNAQAFAIQGTDDLSNSNMTVTVSAGQGIAASVVSITGVVRQRYWRINYVNSGSAQTAFEIAVCSSSSSADNVVRGFASSGANLNLPTAATTAGTTQGTGISVAPLMGNAPTDGANPSNNTVAGSNAGACYQAVIPFKMISATNGWMERTPNIFRGGQFSAAGQNTIWTPRTGNKFRLMKYKIEVGEDATLSGGPSPINLAFTETIPSTAATGASIANINLQQYTHRLVVPASVLATSSNLYDSGLIDLGNGALANNANYPLAMGIMIPQSTSAVNPAWTIASNQWEAATVGFKTTGALGNFKIVQSVFNVTASSVASLAAAAINNTPGNAIFVFIRYTKVVGGAATITVTDTAGNTYTVTTQVANASDTANGAAICMAYCLNATGNSANVITVNFGTNNANGASMQAYEYAGLGSVGIDSAQVGTTGSSTTPASGNYTPGTAGDLIFSFYGTGANVAAVPTVGSNFRQIGTQFAATSGSLGVADNFGNGALTAGLINVMAIGTEE